jgi:hypothetical protein
MKKIKYEIFDNGYKKKKFKPQGCYKKKKSHKRKTHGNTVKKNGR